MEPSGGAEPTSEAQGLGHRAEQQGCSQGLPGDKALRGGQKQPERSGERPDLEGQAPHSRTCTEGTQELRAHPPPRTDIAFSISLCATAALCGKGSSLRRLDGHPSP